MITSAKRTFIITGLACLSLLCAPICAGAQTDEEAEFKQAVADQGLTQQEFDTCFMYYYKQPTPGILIKSLKALLACDSVVRDPGHLMPTLHLIASAARLDPAMLDDLKDLETSYTGIQKEVIAAIIAQTEDYVSPPPVSPGALDYLWAEFIATGADTPVLKIMRVLEDYPATDFNKQMVQNAAIWSLTANARQHKKVFSTIEQEAATASGKYKETLEGMLSKVKEAAVSQGPYPEPR